MCVYVCVYVYTVQSLVLFVEEQKFCYIYYVLRNQGQYFFVISKLNLKYTRKSASLCISVQSSDKKGTFKGNHWCYIVHCTKNKNQCNISLTNQLKELKHSGPISVCLLKEINDFSSMATVPVKTDPLFSSNN